MRQPFKMKNSALRMSAKSGSPMQSNYASPVKGKLDDLLKGVFSKANTASKKVNKATQKVGSDAASAVSQVTSGADKVSKGVQKEVTKVSKGVQGVISNIFGKKAIAKRKAKRLARKKK